MNKNLLLLITFLCTALSTSSLEANPKKLTCLVSGEKINVSDAETANYKDGKVYFCCPGCSSDFVENNRMSWIDRIEAVVESLKSGSIKINNTELSFDSSIKSKIQFLEYCRISKVPHLPNNCPYFGPRRQS